MAKIIILIIVSLLSIVVPVKGTSAVLYPCTVVAYANGNVYIQAPSYSQTLAFDSAATLPSSGCDQLTSATITIANPPQNPPPTAPAYMSLVNGTTSPGTQTSQLLVVQGTITITKADFPDWFLTSGYYGVNITSPSTPWVPSSITIVWQ